MSEFTRPAEPNDGEALRPVLEQWIRHPETGEVLFDEVDEVAASIEQSALDPSRRQYVVMEDDSGAPIAVMGLQRPDETMLPFTRTENPGELINAYVSNDRRRKGVGKLLVALLENIADMEGHTELVVNSGPRYRETGWPFWTRMYGEPAGVAKDLYGLGNSAMVWRKEF